MALHEEDCSRQLDRIAASQDVLRDESPREA
jgi:hypothetical protein